MSHYVDISALADQVMESVKVDSVTKTASATPPKVKTVAAARELRKLAEDMRQMPEADDVGDEDLAALMQDQEVQQLVEALEQNPELLQQLLAEQSIESDGELDAAALDMPIDPNDPDGDGDAEADIDGDGDGPIPVQPPPAEPAKMAAELRKIASALRNHDVRFKQIRMLKAANMLKAATALKHLTGEST